MLSHELFHFGPCFSLMSHSHMSSRGIRDKPCSWDVLCCVPSARKSFVETILDAHYKSRSRDLFQLITGQRLRNRFFVLQPLFSPAYWLDMRQKLSQLRIFFSPGLLHVCRRGSEDCAEHLFAG